MIAIYIILFIFLGFVLIFVAYYIFKAGIGFELSSPKFTTSSEIPSQHPEEKNRIHPRIDVNWEISIETPDGPIAAELKNISFGGAFIRCKKPLAVGEVFRLTIPFGEID